MTITTEVRLSAKDQRALIGERRKNPPALPSDMPVDALIPLGTLSTGLSYVEHRPDCDCSVKEIPAHMLDERYVEGWAASAGLGLNVLASGGIYEALKQAAAKRGRPFGRISESRWNSRGEGIGPRLEVRTCEVQVFWRLQERIVELIEQAAGEL